MEEQSIETAVTNADTDIAKEILEESFTITTTNNELPTTSLEVPIPSTTDLFSEIVATVTSTDSDIGEISNEEIQPDSDIPPKQITEVPNETIVNIIDNIMETDNQNSDLPVKDNNNINETAISDVDANESLNFTEKSINISQINMSHQDDSNDAFNALKESELDALNPKIELEDEIKDNDNNDDKELQSNETISNKTALAIDNENDNDILQNHKEKGTQVLESSECNNDQTDNTPVTIEASTTVEEEIETSDKIVDTNEDANTELDQSADLEVEDDDQHDEGDSVDNMNGEGVDDNVCLLGDTEREISEADKERAVQPNEIEEDDEDNIDDSSTVVELDEPVTDDIEKDGTEEQMDVEDGTVIDETLPTNVEQLKENEIREIAIEKQCEQKCLNCENVVHCIYELMENSGEHVYLCTYECVTEHCEDNPDKYKLIQKRVYIYPFPAKEEYLCCECAEMKLCSYSFRISSKVPMNKDTSLEESEKEAQQPETSVIKSIRQYLCTEECFEKFRMQNPDKYEFKTKKYSIDDNRNVEKEQMCFKCDKLKESKYQFSLYHDKNDIIKYICDEECLNMILLDYPTLFRVKRGLVRVRSLPKHVTTEEPELKVIARTDAEVEAARCDREASLLRNCMHCRNLIILTKHTVHWETYDFCDSKCLSDYQALIGATCTTCNNAVSLLCLGKFSVRFGNDVKQFCQSSCLEIFKKILKQCTYCLRDLSSEHDIVLARVGNKKLYKDFCNQMCLNHYEEIVNRKRKQISHMCSVCKHKKIVKIEVLLDGGMHHFCSNPCFSAFKFVNNVAPDQCDMCLKYFERKLNDAYTVQSSAGTKIFCTPICLQIYTLSKREIWKCLWCKVSKYNFDMLETDYGSQKMCSVNCLKLYQLSLAAPKIFISCSYCNMAKQAQYNITMSDKSIRNFCSYQCVMGFQLKFTRLNKNERPDIVPTGTAKRIKITQNLKKNKGTIQPSTSKSTTVQIAKTSTPVISRVQSLSRPRGRPPNRPKSPIPMPEITVRLERLENITPRLKVSSIASLRPAEVPVQIQNKTQVVTIPPVPKQIANKSTACKVIQVNKAISCRVSTKDAECQTEDYLERKVIIPIPVPIYVPQPMYMYNMPTPIPVPFPLPIPVPIFIPTTRNSAAGIMKEIKKIQEKMPTDPYEAELLMMAEMVAGDKKREETDSDSEQEIVPSNEISEYTDTIENTSFNNEDLVQMAFKMASSNEYEDPPVDLESEMTANTITQNSYGEEIDPHVIHHHQMLIPQAREVIVGASSIQPAVQRGRKRITQSVIKHHNTRATPSKRIKREIMEVIQQQPEIAREPVEKPDANMCLKYTFGVNAWKQWVATKNADFEKSSIRRKPIKSEILQLTADELNFSLCMFVKEVRKPNGSEYAPDTIYYLVLGIQQYLYVNGRIDNIFTDRYYEPFTDCLDEVAKKFSILYNDSQYIVTRVEEEHLWECQQLGAHSPHVLLSTLMFFNTKHFNLVTVDEHMELSFSHIMKHWKRNPNQPGAAKVPGSRNVLLRFYPPQSSLDGNSRKKKVYEQQENEDNILRCPVKLYEFYLSKCPESVKTRNDVFYLQPERSCVPDSPVWYSTQPLGRDALSKMLHRVKMVKEINIALLTS